jgi:hypothetical protein
MTRIFGFALAGLVLLVVLGVPDPPEAAAAANQSEPSMRRGGEPEHGKGSHDVHGVKAPKVKHFYRHRNRHARSHPHGSGV